jgi:hypothetical protein
MRTWRPWARALRDDLEPLWVGGLALAQVYLGSRLLPLRGEAYEWAQYLALGVAVPLALLAASRAPCPPAAGTALKVGLALACLAAGLGLLPHGGGARSLLLLLAAGQLAVFVAALAYGDRATWPPRPSALLVGGAVLALGWGVALRWAWWAPSLAWLTASPYAVAATAAALLLTAVALAPARPGPPRRWAWLSHVPALGVLLLASLDLPLRSIEQGGSRLPFLDRNIHYHWSVLAGPAALVRQGGWPLWDVPCQYGYLSTLAIATLPAEDVWQSLYTLNAGLLFLSAAVVYGLLRACRPGAVGYAFALLLSLAAVFGVPGWPAQLLGPFGFPMVAAFRFLWCYALLAVLAWDHRRAERVPAGRAPLWAGCVCWLLGTLWSGESAAYCLTVWLPALALLALRRALWLFPGPAAWRRRAGVLAAWLAVPPLLLAGAAAVVGAVYAVGLGHLPDWSALFEYCAAASGGFSAMPMAVGGPVWGLLLVFCALATAAAYCLRGPGPLRDLPLLTGAAAALWAAGSYFVSRSHGANATHLSPVAVAAAAAALQVLARRGAAAPWATCVRLSLLPLLSALLALSFAQPSFLRERLRDAAQGPRRVGPHLGPVDPALSELLAAAGAGAESPLVVLGPQGTLCRAGQATAVPRSWVPATPAGVLAPLGPERREVYFARFVERRRWSGWLAVPAGGPTADCAWVPELIARTHAAGRTLRNAAWRLTWYEYRGAAEDGRAANSR